MRIIKLFACFFLMIICFNSYALQIRELNPHHKANIVISNHEFNRISIEDDRITNIFTMKDQFII
jgi:hypothetical protein